MGGAISPLALLVVGVVAGIASGLFGIGGGLIMVPIFTLLLKMDAHRATATSLAVVLLPVALPAVWKFSNEGKVDWRVVLWVAIGFAAASRIGAKLNLDLNEVNLRRVFAVLLVAAAIQMALKPPKNAPKTAPPGTGPALGGGAFTIANLPFANGHLPLQHPPGPTRLAMTIGKWQICNGKCPWNP